MIVEAFQPHLWTRVRLPASPPKLQILLIKYMSETGVNSQNSIGEAADYLVNNEMAVSYQFNIEGFKGVAIQLPPHIRWAIGAGHVVQEEEGVFRYTDSGILLREELERRNVRVVPARGGEFGGAGMGVLLGGYVNQFRGLVDKAVDLT